MADDNLKKIDQIIKEAQKKGVDFGDTDPRHRLRYYTKLDLLPPAERKCFGDENQPTGAYPAYVVDLLVEIDQELEKGKSIKAIAEEKKEEKQKRRQKEKEEEQRQQKREERKKEEKRKRSSKTQKESPKQPSPKKGTSYRLSSPFTLIPTYRKGAGARQKKQKSSKKEAIQEVSSQPQAQRRGFKVFFHTHTRSVLKVGLLLVLLVFFSHIVLAGGWGGKMPSGMLAFLSGGRLAQETQETDQISTFPEVATSSSDTLLSLPESYLTVNVETDLRAPLNLKGATPTVSFHQEGFEGVLSTPSLSGDRSYRLPDQSGTICLSSGNCAELAGGLTSEEATSGRVPVFADPNTITDSSFQDLYPGGVLLSLTEEGEIETRGPIHIGGSMEVEGPIYPAPEPGEDEAVVGTEDSPLRIESGQELGLYLDEDGNLGVGKSDPNYRLDVEGKIQASGDICTDQGGGKCLSEMTAGGTTFIGGGGGGIDGSGSSGYLARWTGSEEIGNSELYQSGGNIGIGNTSPSSLLDVSGTVTMDSFKMATGATSGYVLTADDSGVGTWQEVTGLPAATSGNTLYFSDGEWSTSSLLTNTGQAIGIGTSSPSSALSVQGALNVTGTTTLNGVSYLWPDSDGSTNQVLETDGAGTLAWTSVEGTSDTDWYISTSSSQMYSSTGVDYVGVGTTNPSSMLSVAGSSYINGQLSIATSGLSQLVLENGDETAEFAVGATDTEIVTSGNMTINSLSGEIKTGGDVNLFDASNATVSAASFLSDDASVRSSGEHVLRGSTPIYPYSMPAQSSENNYVRVSKQFTSSDSLASLTPDELENTTRKYAFLINYADDIPSGTSSDWRIYRSAASSTYQSFSVSGQSMASLNEGSPYMTEFYSLPDNDWQLEVDPKGNNIRVFNILLLTYDKLD